MSSKETLVQSKNIFPRNFINKLDFLSKDRLIKKPVDKLAFDAIQNLCLIDRNEIQNAA